MAAGNVPWMALALLTLLAGLQTPALSKVSVQPNFKQDQFLGRWFITGMASNATWLQEKMSMNKSVSISQVVATSAENGALKLTVTYIRKAQCQVWSVLLQPTGTPGHYRLKPKRGDNHEILVVDTDYNQYAIFITQTNTPGKEQFSIILYTGLQNQEALKEKFRTFAHSQGLTDEAIVFLQKTDKCIDDQ